MNFFVVETGKFDNSPVTFYPLDGPNVIVQKIKGIYDLREISNVTVIANYRRIASTLLLFIIINILINNY